jgi:hypothetical protein
MFNKLVKMFKEPEHGIVKLRFVALNEFDEPYEDMATMPYHDKYVEEVVKLKFTNFMSLRKHKVLEITILKIIKKTS